MTYKERKKRIKKASDRLVKWIGSTNSLILHTVFFVFMIALLFFDIDFDKVMLILTTIVSLEAIYLAIFIQMTVNKHGEELEEVSEDIDEIQEDVDEIQKDIDEIQEDVDEIEKKEDQEIKRDWPTKNEDMLLKIENNLGKLIEEILELKKINALQKEEQDSKKKKK
jgi:uncharacterized protein YoxC